MLQVRVLLPRIQSKNPTYSTPSMETAGQQEEAGTRSSGLMKRLQQQAYAPTNIDNAVGSILTAVVEIISQGLSQQQSGSSKGGDTPFRAYLRLEETTHHHGYIANQLDDCDNALPPSHHQIEGAVVYKIILPICADDEVKLLRTADGT